MMHYDPAKRPTADECLQYKFFQVRVPIPINAPEAVDMEASMLLDEIANEEENMSFGYGENEPNNRSKKMTREQLETKDI